LHRQTRIPLDGFEAELGKPDAFVEAKGSAMQARRFGLAYLIETVGRVQRAAQETRLQALVEMAQAVPKHKNEMSRGYRWS